jgi:hypothetical protein
MDYVVNLVQAGNVLGTRFFGPSGHIDRRERVIAMMDQDVSSQFSSG